jgi:broad specificity phosphatase PhoE
LSTTIRFAAVIVQFYCVRHGQTLHNCSITELECDDAQARLLCVNRVEHLAAIGLGTKGEL